MFIVEHFGQTFVGLPGADHAQGEGGRLADLGRRAGQKALQSSSAVAFLDALLEFFQPCLKTLSPAAGILSLLSVRNFLKKLYKDGLAHGHTSFRLQIKTPAPEEVYNECGA